MNESDARLNVITLGFCDDLEDDEEEEELEKNEEKKKEENPNETKT